MKKIFTIVAAALCCANLMAVNCKLNNPQDGNGYIVLWDCDADDWAASNDFMPGQTVTIAFDVTGSVWEEALKGAAPEGTTLTLAAHVWFDIVKNGEVVKSAVTPVAHVERMMQIKGNIYGATVNLAQQLEAANAGDGALVATSGTDLWARGILHIANFKNADGTPGEVWWQENHDVDNGSGVCLYATSQSDGSAIDPAFTGADYTPAMFIIDQPGYAAPCADLATGFQPVRAKAGVKKFVEKGALYLIDANGMKHSVLGAVVR